MLARGGGLEASLAMPVHPVRAVSKTPGESLVRLHIGLEDPDDLMEDLGVAFARI